MGSVLSDLLLLLLISSGQVYGGKEQQGGEKLCEMLVVLLSVGCKCCAYNS